MQSTKRKSDEVVFPISVFETAATKKRFGRLTFGTKPCFYKKDEKGKDWGLLKKELCIK